jgi:hypothetical protein
MPRIKLPHCFVPRAYQRRLMRYFDAGGLRASCIWHRRAGKDRVMLAHTSNAAFKRVGLYWHLLPSLAQGRKSVWDAITRDGLPLMRTTLPDAIVKGRNEHEMKVTLRNGSIVQIVGADRHDTWVGSNPIGVTFSEWALTNPSAWEFLRPILRENGGWAAFIGTPRGYNHAHATHLIAQREPGWYADTQTIDDTGILTREQYAQEIAEGMPEELARQEYLCDFSAANVGAVLGRWLEQAEREMRVLPLVADIEAAARAARVIPEVMVSSDIGRRDASAFWFWMRRVGGYDLIDYDEDVGLAAEDWIPRLRQRVEMRGMRIDTLYLPHDAHVRTFASKLSVEEQFRTSHIAKTVMITPLTAIKDRIEAARSIFRRCRFDSDNCAVGLDRLRGWSYEWDEDTKVFSKEPKHDYCSHGGDAFTYGALSLDVLREPKVEVRKPIEGLHTMTMDELWKRSQKFANNRRVR